MNNKNRILFHQEKKREGFFSIEVLEKTSLTFVFNNKKVILFLTSLELTIILQWMEAKEITFAIEIGNYTKSFLEKKEIDPMEQKLSDSLNTLIVRNTFNFSLESAICIQEIQENTRLAGRRQETFYKSRK